MLTNNTLYDETNLTDGFSTYSYPGLMNKETGGNHLTEQFVRSINTNIVGKDISPYPIMNQVLYKALMGKQKVLLGEMPEILYRQILANSLSLAELKDIFRFLMLKLEKMDNPTSFREASHNIFPHIFNLPKDLYQTALLKESFQAALCIAAFVGIHQFIPIQQYWEGAPHGINYSEATRIPDRPLGERDEELIEKHALLDSLLENRAWGRSYIVNPFPYIDQDVTNFGIKDFKAMKECFLFHYTKYEKFKKMNEKVQIPSYEERLVSLMRHEEGKKDLQVQLETEFNLTSSELDLRDDLELKHYRR